MWREGNLPWKDTSCTYSFIPSVDLSNSFGKENLVPCPNKCFEFWIGVQPDIVLVEVSVQ